MQEFHQFIQKALVNGLRSDSRERKGAPAMEELRNLKPSELGAISPEVVTYTLVSPSFPSSPDWPFPQLRPFATGSLLFSGTGVYRVLNEAAAGAALSLFQAASPNSSATLAANGGDVHVATFQNFSWWATDGVNLMFRAPGNTSNRVLAFDTAFLKCSSVERFADRLFIGGASGTLFAGSRFLAFFDLWRNSAAGRLYTSTIETFGLNYLIWGEEGGGDTMYPFETLKYFLGLSLGGSPQDAYTDAFVRDLIESGRIGLIPLEHTGDVKAVRAMGNRLMVYGNRGVSALVPSEYKSLGQTNVVGFVESPVTPLIGIGARGAISGDDTEHIYLGTDDDLWRVSPDGPTRLGYKEFTGGLVAADVVISFDREQRDFWICDGIACWVKSRTGLGGPMSVLPSSVFRSPNTTALVGTAPEVDFDAPEPTGSPPDMDPADPDIVLARTVPFDCGTRGQKHITNLQFGADGMRDTRGTIHYRFDKSGSYRRKKHRNVSPEGFCRIDANTTDFKVEILGASPGQNARIDKIDLRYQFDDRREVRGAEGIPEQS